MMRNYLIYLLLIPLFSLSQPNTEVHLFDITNTEGELSLTNPRNASNSEGYDNQPSFYNDNMVLFVSTRNNQTDIATYNLRDKSVSFINNTPNGGEYSPLKIPNTKNVSAVRLDDDGKQRLYHYDFETGASKVLIDALIVAYYTWYDENTIVSAVIEDSGLNLYVTNTKTGKSTKYADNVGRSFHKIPNSNLVSFISKDDEKWLVKSIQPSSGTIEIITELPSKTEDMCWLSDGSILLSSKNTIYKSNPKTDKTFTILKSFDNDNLQNISRIATNKTGTLLALISEVSPEYIVQKQLDAYNARDIDAFMATYSKDIKLYNFPTELRSEGQDPMRKSYTQFFNNSTDLNCKILKRIVIDNKVIDHEEVTANGNTFKAVAVYEIENGLISKVTFIR